MYSGPLALLAMLRYSLSSTVESESEVKHRRSYEAVGFG